MSLGPLDRTPPEGAERWFYAPRNPMIPSPTNDQVIASAAGPGGDGVTAYRGAGLPPAPESLLAHGGWFFREAGTFFLPFVPEEQRSWLAAFDDPADALITTLVGAFLPVGFFVFEAARDVMVSELIFGNARTERTMRTIERRWQHPNLFVIPNVNIVEVAYCKVKGRGLFAKATEYVAITVDDGSGQTTSYTLTPADESMPAAFFTARMSYEVEFLRDRASRSLGDYDERARLALGALGLEVTAPQVTVASILAALQTMIDAGRGAELEGLTTGAVADALKDAADSSWSEVQSKWGDELPAELSRHMLRELEPMLPYYRRVPATAHTLLLMERVASEALERDWAPPWRIPDYRFNFRDGEPGNSTK